MAIIPDKNPKALIGYYLGFVALLPCAGLLFAIPAVVLGIMGYRYSLRFPEAQGGGHAIVGIVLGVMSVLLNGACGGFVILSMIMSQA